MTIDTVSQTIEAQFICGHEGSGGFEVFSACGADLMSDVMAFVKDRVLLLTGLVNVQVIRTADLLDIGAVCFVRGKTPTQDMINLAGELGIILLKTRLPMFLACGKLYEAGLKGGGVRVIQ